MPDKRTVPAVLYAAKSTEDKHGSIPDQLVRTTRLADSESWSVAGEFSDEGFSAYSGNRGPDLEKAKALAIKLAAEDGECFLVALHSDRIARGAGDAPGAADHLVEVVASLRRYGVRLRTVEDDFFADERIGLLMAAVQGQRNSEDSRRKSESVQAGLQRRAERGLFSGPRPYGYVYAKDESGLEPYEPEVVIVGRIYAEYVAGRSLSDIARGLHRDKIPTLKGGTWRVSTVSGILRNPVYTGRITYRKKVLPGIHQPTIDQDLWARAAALISATPERRGRQPKGKRHLFTGGFLRHAGCGEAMVPRTRPESGYEFYECDGRKVHGCKAGAFRREDIDGGVLNHFEQLALDLDATREALAAAMNQKTEEAQALLYAAEIQVHGTEANLAKVRRDYTHGDLTAAEWRELRADLESEEGAAKSEAGRLREQVATVQKKAAAADAGSEVVELLSRLRAHVKGELTAASDIDALRAVLHRLFDGFIFHTEPPKKAHVELIDGDFWIEPVISETAIASFEAGDRPVMAREPLYQAGNNSRIPLPSR